MSHAPFSLLLPVYHRDTAERFTQALLSSTSEQHLQPQQVVIVQDGPIAAELSEAIDRAEHSLGIPVTRVLLDRNVGLAEALNRGLEACRYDIVARMDADDVSLPRRFSRQWLLMEQGYDLVGTGMVEIGERVDQPGALRVPPVGAKRIRDHARTHNPFNHPTMMYRRSTLARVGNYEPFGSMEDYWLGIRLIAAGAKVENIPDPLLAYRVDGGVFHRRGGVQAFKTELALQRKMREMRFIRAHEYVRNVVLKGLYRLFPAGLKRVLFRAFISGGLRGDRRASRARDAA